MNLRFLSLFVQRLFYMLLILLKKKKYWVDFFSLLISRLFYEIIFLKNFFCLILKQFEIYSIFSFYPNPLLLVFFFY